MTAIHQLLSDFAYGDAIGNMTLQFETMLHELGYQSRIFADVIDPRVADRARSASELEQALRPGDAVVYHLSIGSPVARLLERIPARRLIYYHNITPAAYYRGINDRVALRLERGRADLRRLVPAAEVVMAPSDFNLDECRALGARRTVRVPPPVDVTRLRPRPAVAPAVPTLLFVGRIAPNKRIENLIRLLVTLRATAQPRARLVVVGHSLDVEPYLHSLWRFATELGVAGALHMPGGNRGISDAALGDLYASSSAYVTMSEHEGFCLPLLEAMSFELPEIAYAAGAVGETLCDAGLALPTTDPLVWAEALERVTARGWADRHRARQQRRLAAFEHATIRERLRAAVGG